MYALLLCVTASLGRLGCGRGSKSVSTGSSHLQPPTAHVLQESRCQHAIVSARSNRRVRKAWLVDKVLYCG